MSRTKSEAFVCAVCSEVRKKFPATWVRNDGQAYCSSCWAKVSCTSCGHHDPKGSVYRGRWTCRGCRHRQRTTTTPGSVQEACHRFIIEDQNGEPGAPASSAATGSESGGAAAAAGSPTWVPQIPAAGALQGLGGEVEEDEEDDEEQETSDLVGPLRAAPSRAAGRGAAAGAGKSGAALGGGREEQQPCHIILLLDASGSMRLTDVEGSPDLSRLQAAAKCAADFATAHTKVRPQDIFSLATFAEDAKVHASATSAPGVQEAINELPIRGANGTFYRPALEAACRLLDLQPGLKGHVLLLSDGCPADTKVALALFQERLVRPGVHLHGIAFGSTVESFAPLQQLACLSSGTFTMSGCSVRSLIAAFSSVSTTISSMSSGSSGTTGGNVVGNEARTENGTLRHRVPRLVEYELPEVGVFGRRGVLRFNAARSSFRYDGTAFHEESWPASQVVRRARPYMRGGMRLVYGFRDAKVVPDESSWMVAKCSRFQDEVLNSRAIVETHAKSTAVARHFAARFNDWLQAAGASSEKTESSRVPTLFFVPCFVYELEEGSSVAKTEPRCFAAERYLPGAFLKYNSNNGYVAEAAIRHHDAVQAFLHFSFEASNGHLLVADLQGVARQAEVLLTDPQVLSLHREFGPGDLGPEGMRACLAAHRCGATCKRLGLRPVTAHLLRRLAAAAGGSDRRHSQRPSSHAAAVPGSRPSSAMSTGSNWEVISSEAGSEGDWEAVPHNDPQEFALSDGVRSSQASSSSWVHLLDT